jgi:uncharacterized membrane protein YdjX (TVP38/TMEM64 family)
VSDVAAPRGRSPLKTWAPLAVLIAGLGLAWATGLTDYLSLDALQRNRARLEAYRDAHPWLTLLGYMGIYVVVVVFSIPGALIMTLTGGMLFGGWAGGAAAVAAASIGATIIFLVARTSIGAALRARAGPMISKIISGFEANAASYLLTLRLIPGVPFFAVNLAAGLVRMRVLTYVLITVVGIAPASFIYASIGASLVAVFARGGKPDLGVIFEPHVFGPLLGLAALSLLPVLYHRLRPRRAAADLP